MDVRQWISLPKHPDGRSTQLARCYTALRTGVHTKAEWNGREGQPRYSSGCKSTITRVSAWYPQLGVFASSHSSEFEPNPCEYLAGKAPVEVFTGLEREPVVGVIVMQSGRKDPTRVAIQDVMKYASDLDLLRQSLMALHQDVTDEKERRRLIQSASKKGQMCKFTVKDFVLWSRADPRMQGGKLMVRWVGPFQFVKELPTSFLIKHLLTEETFDVHAIRLKHYADDMLQVTEELKHQVSLQGINLGVRAVKRGRYNRLAKEWELLVGLIGLEGSEDLREAMAGMWVDTSIPDMATLDGQPRSTRTDWWHEPQ